MTRCYRLLCLHLLFIGDKRAYWDFPHIMWIMPKLYCRRPRLRVYFCSHLSVTYLSRRRLMKCWKSVCFMSLIVCPCFKWGLRLFRPYLSWVVVWLVVFHFERRAKWWSLCLLEDDESLLHTSRVHKGLPSFLCYAPVSTLAFIKVKQGKLWSGYMYVLIKYNSCTGKAVWRTLLLLSLS